MMVDFNPENFDPKDYIVKSDIKPDLIVAFNENQKEVIKIDKDGRIFWAGREVETDDEFRGVMKELAETLARNMRGYSISEDAQKYWYNKGHNDGRNLRT